jgi:UPF0755 protein
MIDDPTTTTDAPPAEEPADAVDLDARSRFLPRSRRARALVATALALVVVVAGSGVWLLRQIDPPGAPGEPVTVEIPDGTSVGAAAAILEDRDVISSARIFRLYLRVTGRGSFQAGIYRRGELRENMSMGAAASALSSGPEIEYHRVTVPEGFWLEDVAGRVDDLPGLSGAKFLEAAASGAVVSRFQPEGVATLEGLVFPDTYFVAEDETEEGLLRRMVQRFEQVADDVGLEARAAARGRTPYELVILASLVEEETKVPRERVIVAGVIENRLARGMLLQVDATIDYAHGEHLTRKLFRHLEIDSPYNTYRNPGLPPTPIAAPGEASLRAAASPERTDFLFYVLTADDGSHAFARTNAEHERNAADARRRGVLP